MVQGESAEPGYKAAQWYLCNTGLGTGKCFSSLAPHLALTLILVSFFFFFFFPAFERYLLVFFFRVTTVCVCLHPRALKETFLRGCSVSPLA